MPRVAVNDNKRMNLRVRPEQEARLMRAAEAKIVIEDAERIVLSERDSLLVLILLESPPAPNARLRAAIAAMP